MDIYVYTQNTALLLRQNLNWNYFWPFLDVMFLENMVFWSLISDSIAWAHNKYSQWENWRYVGWKSEDFNSQFDDSFDSNDTLNKCVLLTSTLFRGHNLEIWLQHPAAVWVLRSKRWTRSCTHHHWKSQLNLIWMAIMKISAIECYLDLYCCHEFQNLAYYWCYMWNICFMLLLFCCVWCFSAPIKYWSFSILLILINLNIYCW